MPIPDRSDADLKALALDYVAGKVYTTQDVPANLWHMVFMPLLFTERRALRGVRMAYAIVGKDTTSGQAINGYPIFFSCALLKKRDVRKWVAYVDEARALLADFTGPTR